MRIVLFSPPWVTQEPPELHGVQKILNGIWTDAAVDYAADWTAKQSFGKRGPVGVQKYLNKKLDSAFEGAGWECYSSTFTTHDLWFRVTFRHQMSAGSNIVDAMKALGRGRYRTAVIAAATRDFLEQISPADAPALTSFEKLRAELIDLDGILRAPIYLAALRPASVLPAKTLSVILSSDRRR